MNTHLFRPLKKLRIHHLNKKAPKYANMHKKVLNDNLKISLHEKLLFVNYFEINKLNAFVHQFIYLINLKVSKAYPNCKILVIIQHREGISSTENS